jgi:hypothetical protein
MDDNVKKRIQKLHEGIRSHPDLHTRSYSFGARIYDGMELIDTKPYYIRIAFDLHPETRLVTILSTTVMQVSGPH